MLLVYNGDRKMSATRLTNSKDEENRRILDATDHKVLKMLEAFLRTNGTLTTSEIAILDSRDVARLGLK